MYDVSSIAHLKQSVHCDETIYELRWVDVQKNGIYKMLLILLHTLQNPYKTHFHQDQYKHIPSYAEIVQYITSYNIIEINGLRCPGS